MADSISDTLSRAAEELFQPLATLAMRERISPDVLLLAMEMAFVRAADRQALGLGQPIPNISALSARTGLSRPRCRLMRQSGAGGPSSAPLRTSQLLRVLESWHGDPDFQDDEGKPRVLSQRGPLSFTELVRRQGGGLRAGAILKELVRIDAVRLTDTERVEMLNRADLDADRRTQAIRDLGEYGSECLQTLVCRILDFTTNQYYRRVVGLYINKDDVRRLVNSASASAEVWASGFQDSMSEKRVIVKPESTPGRAIRLAGHFLISERPVVVPPLDGKAAAGRKPTAKATARSRQRRASRTSM